MRSPEVAAAEAGAARIADVALGDIAANGGVYLRVSSSSLLETTSWGFCVRPHATTTPFGAAGYAKLALGDGWYRFTANDDWY